MKELSAAAPSAFADLLRASRQRARLTQQELATATKLPRSLISELEHGRTPVRLVHVRLLAGRLATSVAEFQEMIACADPAAGTRRWGPRTGISPALEREILAKLNAGLTDGETAASVGLTASQVTSVRQHFGQPALPPGERTARQFADLDRQIIADYRAGVPYAKIVERYDVPRSTLYEILERFQVPRRRQTGGRRPASSAVAASPQVARREAPGD